MTALELVLHLALLLLFPPLLLGVIGKVKAWFGGRTGPPLLMPYYDVLRLLRKGAVYSPVTTWIFRAGPMVSLTCALGAGLLLPLCGVGSPLGFPGDVVAFAALLALGRVFTMLAALDTGSSFEGMGASREASFSALAEPGLFLALTLLCVPSGSASFEQALLQLPEVRLGAAHPTFLFASVVLFAVLLAENARIPVDDPATHLELTMVHEVMVLEHSGPDFAFILYGSAVKLFVMAALLVELVVPLPHPTWWMSLLRVGLGTLGVAVLVGVVESAMARLRLQRVPQFLVAAAVLGAIGLGFLFFRGQP